MYICRIFFACRILASIVFFFTMKMIWKAVSIVIAKIFLLFAYTCTWQQFELIEKKIKRYRTLNIFRIIGTD